eukprot:1427368-Pleurochrysis_carterae.AAC.1
MASPFGKSAVSFPDRTPSVPPLVAQVRKLESLCGELASYAKGHPLAYESSFYSVEAPCCAEASVTPPPVVRASTTGSMSSTTCGLTTRTSSSLSIAAVS